MAKVKQETSVTEFFLWKAYFDEEVNEFNPLHWYLAQIAFEVFNVPFRVWGKQTDVKIKDFLLKFTTSEADPEVPDRPEVGSEEWKEHVRNAKRMFGVMENTEPVEPGKELQPPEHLAAFFNPDGSAKRPELPSITPEKPGYISTRKPATGGPALPTVGPKIPEGTPLSGTTHVVRGPHQPATKRRTGFHPRNNPPTT